MEMLDSRIVAADRALLRASFTGDAWAIAFWRNLRDTLARQRRSETILSNV
jgi:hypothetical protein